MVNMLKIVNHIGTTSGSQEKHLKFPINVDPRGSYRHHLVVRVDTGADVNCMNEKTFKRLFPKVKLAVCPHKKQNFGNSVTDISILGQFCTYLQFRGEKYLNTLVKQGILEEVKEHTDWVNSYVIVEKDTGNHHSPNHTVKKKLRIHLDPRDLNEALEREPYYTHSTGEITAKFPSRDRMEHARHFPTSMEMCMDNHLTPTTEKTQ